MYQRGKKVVSAISGNTTSSLPCAVACCKSAISRCTTAARSASRAIGPSCAQAIVRYLDMEFLASRRLCGHEGAEQPHAIGEIRHGHRLIRIVAAMLVADEDHIGGKRANRRHA